MTDHPIYFLWATPRSTSTAFEWMMRQRGDLTCFHEPFGVAWYYGPDARAPRPVPADKRRMEASFENIWQDIQQAATKHPVFVKDMPHHTDHLWDGDFLGRITHSFLIREPAKVLASLHRSYQKAGMQDGFEAHEISFESQQALYTLLCQHGDKPPILDSDDLLEQPHAMVSAYCDAIGIPFIRDALTWEPGSRSEVLWYDGNDEIWHASLRDSNGLKPIPRKHVNPQELPDNVARHYPLFQGIYETMYVHRLPIVQEVV